MKRALKLTLTIEGKEKTFTQHFVPLKIHRKALEMEKEFKEKEVGQIEAIDLRVALLVEAFDHKFTADQVENGLNAIGINDIWYEVIGVGLLGYPTKKELEKQEKEMGKFLAEMKEHTEVTDPQE
ncbi:hypothetical protein RYX56_05690 [Alkalihalophilus lindianensis]|uniref:Phage tail assembly chaperone protein, TAC n=1 Tax=Alkalihalophilus lindianensis TaxID=1630542 RepID=A0ABU3X8A2_9BACI|nr:hypothetical protein [Alkalihalophilus lindianensis]MDV2683801.1 hypothetical protein [Alkalihalophilus lindianensis]MDV2683867.1 hypothetical protein [Alkalihalophilus lindianensis]